MAKNKSPRALPSQQAAGVEHKFQRNHHPSDLDLRGRLRGGTSLCFCTETLLTSRDCSRPNTQDLSYAMKCICSPMHISHSEIAMKTLKGIGGKLAPIALLHPGLCSPHISTCLEQASPKNPRVQRPGDIGCALEKAKINKPS